MLLNKYNCIDPRLWGKDFKWVLNGQIIEPLADKLQMPEEVDFLVKFYPCDPMGAKQYFKIIN